MLFSRRPQEDGYGCNSARAQTPPGTLVWIPLIHSALGAFYAWERWKYCENLSSTLKQSISREGLLMHECAIRATACQLLEFSPKKWVLISLSFRIAGKCPLSSANSYSFLATNTCDWGSDMGYLLDARARKVSTLTHKWPLSICSSATTRRMTKL